MHAKKSITLGAALLLALGSTSMAQNNRNAQSMLFPPTATYAGKSLAEWGQAYWHWAVNIPGPAENFPGINTGSVFQNQTGPVFFLGDSFYWSDQIPQGTPNPGSTYTPEQRSATVSAHTPLFISFDGIYRARRQPLDPGQTPEQALAAVQAEFASYYDPVNVILLIDGQQVAIDTSANSKNVKNCTRDKRHRQQVVPLLECVRKTPPYE